jgi:hypothetical protein
MKTLLRNLGFIIFISMSLTTLQAEARQFVKYSCIASGESAEIVIETRERLNARSLKSSTFDVLIDFDTNNVNFLNNESYRFSFVSNFILEKTTEEEFFLKGYETNDKISYDLKINRKNGDLYFLKSWDLESKSYRVIELKGVCSLNQQQLKFSLKKALEKQSYKFGEIFIEPQFDTAWDFSEGSAAVRVRDNGLRKFGHINRNGDALIPFDYEFVRNFKEGYAGACIKDVEEKCGYIDKKGNWVIEPNYSEVWDFNDGVSSVTIGSENTFINVKTGKESTEGGRKTAYIDKKGEILMNRFFDRAYGFSEGLGSVGNGAKRELLWGYVDKTGEQVIPMKFGPGLISAVGKFVDGIAPALHGHWLNGKYGYINKSGSFIIPPIYQAASDFSEGKASVCRLMNQRKGKDEITFDIDKKYECSYIDKTGKALFPFRQYYYGEFRNGLATACSRDTYLSFSQPSCGFIDATGKMVISKKFVQVENFNNGYARVSISSKPSLWGLINKKGEFVIKPIYSALGDVSEGLISFRLGDDHAGKWGYLWAQ